MTTKEIIVKKNGRKKKKNKNTQVTIVENISTKPKSTNKNRRRRQRKKAMKNLTQQKNKMLTSSSGQMFGNNMPVSENNEYLKALIDPAGNQPKGIPDMVRKVTTNMHLRVANSGYYLTHAYNNLPAGTYYYYSTPDIEYPLHYLWETQDDTNYTTQVSSTITNQTSMYGLFAIDGSEDDTERDALILGTSAQNRCFVGPWVYEDTPDVEYQGWFGQATGTGGFFYGIPGLGTSSNNSYGCQISVVFNQGFQYGDTLTVQVVTQYGVGATYNTTALVGENTLNIGPVSFSNSFTVDSGVPGVGFFLYMTPNSSNVAQTQWHVASVTINSYIGAGTTGASSVPAANCVRMQPLQYPDIVSINSVLTEYRTAAMSFLISYEGPLINNGGTFAMYYYGGGQPPTYEFPNYNEIANREQAYSGPLMKGGYSWWSPADVFQQTTFLKLGSRFNWNQPYIVCSGVVTDITGSVYLRLLQDAHFEGISPAQYIEKTPSRLNPMEIYEANMKIIFFPHSMCNPEHDSKIMDFLKSAGQTLLKGAHWALSNADMILPLLSSFM
jgi:hypothetical protein